MEAASSSAAPATVCTLRVACSEAAATALDCWLVSSAVADIDSAVDCSSAVAEDSWPRTPETLLLKSRVSWSTLRARSYRALGSWPCSAAGGSGRAQLGRGEGGGRGG